MRKVFGILTLVLAPVAGYAAENGLNWAYPVEPPPGNNADAAPPSQPRTIFRASRDGASAERSWSMFTAEGTQLLPSKMCLIAACGISCV